MEVPSLVLEESHGWFQAKYHLPIRPRVSALVQVQIAYPTNCRIKHCKMTRKRRSPSIKLWNARRRTNFWPAFQPRNVYTIPGHSPSSPCVVHWGKRCPTDAPGLFAVPAGERRTWPQGRTEVQPWKTGGVRPFFGVVLGASQVALYIFGDSDSHNIWIPWESGDQYFME